MKMFTTKRKMQQRNKGTPRLVISVVPHILSETPIPCTVLSVVQSYANAMGVFCPGRYVGGALVIQVYTIRFSCILYGNEHMHLLTSQLCKACVIFRAGHNNHATQYFRQSCGTNNVCLQYICLFAFIICGLWIVQQQQDLNIILEAWKRSAVYECSRYYSFLLLLEPNSCSVHCVEQWF